MPSIDLLVTPERTSRAAGVLLVILSLLSACGGDSSRGTTELSRPVFGLPALGLDAYSQVSYRPGTVFSFSLTTIDSDISGRVVDPQAELVGTGLEIVGFAVSRPGADDFDVAADFPPVRVGIAGARMVESAGPFAAGEQGVRLIIGLRVVDNSYTEIRGLTYVIEAADGERQTHSSSVGLAQCFEDGDGDKDCPRGWVKASEPV